MDIYNTKYKQQINTTLGMLCSGGQKVTSEMIQSWEIALNDCDPEHIKKATGIVLQDKSTDYLIKPGKFRDICLQIKRSEKANQEAKNNPVQDRSSRNNKISKKEAIRIQEAIKKGLPVFNKIPCPKIDMVEYLNSDGDAIKIVAQDHVNFEDFEKNCLNQFFATLKKRFHGYHREENRTSPITGKYKTMVQCASDSGGSPITIGIL